MEAAIKRDVRRRTDRSHLRIPVTWALFAQATWDGEIVDASPDGMFVAFDADRCARPRRGDEVTVMVIVGNEGHVVDARVRWLGRHAEADTFGMGVAFTPESAYVAEALAFELCPPPRISGIYER